MASDSTILELSNVAKRFVIRKEKSLKERIVNFGRSNLHKEDFRALQDITLQIEAGTTIGLIGANGSGKSTLLKVIAGILQPDEGVVRRRGRLAALLELGAGFHPDLTGRENVYLNAAILGLSREETDLYFDDIVEFSGIPDFIDTQVKFYSSGMYVRLAFAVAVHTNPDLLIVDEVLAVGDEPFQRKCLNRIRQFQSEGKTIILVSHALEQVAEFCNRVVVLNHGVVQFDGSPAVGIQILREGFDSIVNSEHQVDSEVEAPVAEVLSVRIIGNSADFEAHIRTHDDLDLEVQIEHREIRNELNCEFEIQTTLGHRVFGVNSLDLGFKFASKPGVEILRLHLTDIALGTGTYVVNVAISTIEDGELFRLSSALQFSVEAPDKFSGSAYFPATIEAI